MAERERDGRGVRERARGIYCYNETIRSDYLVLLCVCVCDEISYLIGRMSQYQGERTLSGKAH